MIDTKIPLYVGDKSIDHTLSSKRCRLVTKITEDGFYVGRTWWRYGIYIPNVWYVCEGLPEISVDLQAYIETDTGYLKESLRKIPTVSYFKIIEYYK